MTPPPPFEWKDSEKNKIKMAFDSARRAEYSKLTQAEKHALDALVFPNGVVPPNTPHLERSKKRRAQIQVTDGKVIAELTFYIFTETVAAIKYIAQHLEAPTPGEETPLYRLIEDDLVAVEAQAATLHADLDAFRT